MTAASHLISCILCCLQQSLAIRMDTNLGDPCRIKETLRISYLEQRYLQLGGAGHYDTIQSGEFDFIHPSVWNGVTLATKTYGELGTCSVDYAVHCTGSDVTLKLTDSCHKRTETRKMIWSRRTDLHTEGTWFRQGEVTLYVYPDGQERPIRMHHTGAWVEFRLISPPTLKEQLEDPTKVRFFAQVPKVAACLPDTTDHIWKSNLHNGSYSAQQCAACLNLLESKMKETEVCGAAETSASKLRCQVLQAQMAKEGVLEEVVTTLHKSWNQRTEVMTMPLAWQLGCQDLGCCPLDPDVSKLLIKEAVRSLDMEKFEEAKRDEAKPDSEEMSGVAERVLMDPKARLELESMLEMKVFNSRKNHSGKELYSDLSKMKVATSDSECEFNFKKGQCSPPGSCVYKYRFGDMTFDQSCRLKAKIIQPTSDADCLWNYEKMRCHHPRYCARRCKGDITFDKCCKLRKVPLPVVDETSPQKISQTEVEEVLQDLPKDEADEDDIGLEADEESIGLEADEESIGLEADEEKKPSGDDEDADLSVGAGEDEEEGNCLNDREVLSRPAFAKELEEDVRASLTWKLALKREKCHQKHVKRGLSETCASCFVDVEDCALNRCFSKMTSKGALHPETKACMEKPSDNGQPGCAPALRKCSGLEASELPRPDQ